MVKWVTMWWVRVCPPPSPLRDAPNRLVYSIIYLHIYTLDSINQPTNHTSQRKRRVFRDPQAMIVKEGARIMSLLDGTSKVRICIHMYAYIFMYMCIYVYVYIYRLRLIEGPFSTVPARCVVLVSASSYRGIVAAYVLMMYHGGIARLTTHTH